MSHQEYIKDLTENQLEYLVELSQDKLKSIRDEGWVKLWKVSDGWMNLGWFAKGDYLKAAECLFEAAKDKSRKGYPENLELKLEKIRPSEVEDYLK